MSASKQRFSYELGAIFFQLGRWLYVLWAVFDAVKVTVAKSYIVWRVTPKHQAKKHPHSPYWALHRYRRIV